MRTITGKVVSNKMDKSIVVTVERVVTHPLYKKQYKKTYRFQAHDEKNECQPGDMVEIVETRPISKNKHFKVEKILTKAADKQAKPAANAEKVS